MTDVVMLVLSKVLVAWLALDIIFLATIWYAISTIRPYCTRWWKAHICDDAPRYVD